MGEETLQGEKTDGERLSEDTRQRKFANSQACFTTSGIKLVRNNQGELPPLNQRLSTIGSVLKQKEYDIRSYLSFYILDQALSVKNPHLRYLQEIGVNIEELLDVSQLLTVAHNWVSNELRIPLDQDGQILRLPESASNKAVEDLDETTLQEICQFHGLQTNYVNTQELINRLKPIFTFKVMQKHPSGRYRNTFNKLRASQDLYEKETIGILSYLGRVEEIKKRLGERMAFIKENVIMAQAYYDTLPLPKRDLYWEVEALDEKVYPLLYETEKIIPEVYSILEQTSSSHSKDEFPSNFDLCGQYLQSLILTMIEQTYRLNQFAIKVKTSAIESREAYRKIIFDVADRLQKDMIQDSNRLKGTFRETDRIRWFQVRDLPTLPKTVGELKKASEASVSKIHSAYFPDSEGNHEEKLNEIFYMLDVKYKG